MPLKHLSLFTFMIAGIRRSVNRQGLLDRPLNQNTCIYLKSTAFFDSSNVCTLGLRDSREAAFRALRKIDPRVKFAVPALRKALKDRGMYVRMQRHRHSVKSRQEALRTLNEYDTK
jgi:hypothetical protein